MPGGGGRPSLWATPTPYLFLGLSVIMSVIVVALLVLLCCTHRRPSSSCTRQLEEAGEGEKAASERGVLVPLDREAPRVVVVVMAGDDALPSFLASAKPLAVDPTGAAAAV
ncbi:protein GLUTAMINE DUMPER 6 [Setaria italica]|nr:protein GLUTAMINE DUMPER 6 [Setaria italica]